MKKSPKAPIIVDIAAATASIIGGIGSKAACIPLPNIHIAAPANAKAIPNGINDTPKAAIKATAKKGIPEAATAPKDANPPPKATNPAATPAPNNPINPKNGIDIKANAPAIPNAANTPTPKSCFPPPNALSPIASDFMLMASCFRGVNPINSKKGIEGNANTNAGPANAKFNIPFSTLPAPIALRPEANSFKPDDIPLLDFPVAAPPLVAAVASLDISLGFTPLNKSVFLAPAAFATLFDTILPVPTSLNLPPPAILGSNLIPFAAPPRPFILPTSPTILL